MDMTGERRIAAPRQAVWDALNDPAVLKACIPGCETLEKTGDTDLKATAAVKIGPIAARFTGKVQLTDLNPPISYRISGEGQGGVAGFAKGGADVRLADDGPGTLLSYDVKAQVGGKIAQLGARLIDATSKQMADMFFDRFSAMVTAPAPDTTVAAPAPGTTAAPAPGTTNVALAPGITAPAPDSTAFATQGMAASGVAAAPIRMDTHDPATEAPGPTPAASPALQPRPLPPTPGSISIFSLIPAELFGLPLVAIIGIVLYIPIFILIFKAYVFG